MSNGRGRTAADFRLAFRSLHANYKERFARKVAEFRTKYALPARKDAEVEAVLEAHIRTYVIDGMLAALRWVIVPSTPEQIENMIPEAQIDPATGARRRMDYLGYEQQVDEPLLILEAKRPTMFPTPPNGSMEVLSAIVSQWLATPQKAPGSWRDWLPSLQDYVLAVAQRAGRFPVRAAITDGDWLIIFERPEDAFGGRGARDPNYIHVFPKAEEIIARYDRVFDLLDQRQVSRIAGEITPGEIRGAIDPARVVTVLHGLRLRHATAATVGPLVPTITVVPTIVLRSESGSWFKITPAVVDDRTVHFVPYRYEDVPRHLEEVRADAERLLGRVQQQLGRDVRPTSLLEHYTDDAFEAMHGVEEVVGKDDQFWMVTGQATHYLLPAPVEAVCPFHDFARARERQCQARENPLITPSIATPRAFFTNARPHHCCHADVAESKHVGISDENIGRCGARSGRRGDAFCEVAPLEEYLCCRLCAFLEVCSATEILRLPCALA